jgi:hypothetical protein
MHGYDGPQATLKSYRDPRPGLYDALEGPPTGVDKSQLGAKVDQVDELAYSAEQAAELIAVLASDVLGVPPSYPANKATTMPAPPTHLHRLDSAVVRLREALISIRAATSTLRDAVG